MQTIFKYPINQWTVQSLLNAGVGTTREVKLNLPEGAEILKLAPQNGVLTIWAKVDDGQEPKSRTLQIYGTGHCMGATWEKDEPADLLKLQADYGKDAVPAVNRKFIDTMFTGPYVWHFFEVL